MLAIVNTAPSAPDEEASAQRKALVRKWQKEIQADRDFFEPVFKTMREDTRYTRKGAQKEWPKEHSTINLVQRHVRQKTAALYAKNPRARAKPRPRLDYRLWDGKTESLMRATTVLASGAPDMNAMALVREVREATLRKRMLDNLGKTLEIVFHYQLGEMNPDFKTSMKRMVRRAVTCGVGYVILGYQRETELTPKAASAIETMQRRVATIERLMAERQEGDFGDADAEMEELEQAIKLAMRDEEIAREGLYCEFPKSWQIIPDRKCEALVGWVGADHLTYEQQYTPEEVREHWKADVSRTYTPYRKDGNGRTYRMKGGQRDTDKDFCSVWRVWNKRDGSYFVLCDGHDDYLEEPHAPRPWMESFFPVFAFCPNELESDEEEDGSIFPPSDVTLLRSTQDDYNRARQGLREHRQANRPKYIVTRILEDEDEAALQSHPHSAIIRLNGVEPGARVDDVFQKFPTHGVDPNQYGVDQQFQDLQRTVGANEAVLGGVAGATATETSVAEEARRAGIGSEADDLDGVLTAFARASGQVLLMEMDIATVQRIAGMGAVWPRLTAKQAAQEVQLEIRAGSSGRPNKAADLANFERAMPHVVQIPGISPRFLAEQALSRMGDDLDLDEAIVDGMPSILALNARMGGAGAGTPQVGGDPGSDPAAQGQQGVNNAPRGNDTGGGPQPAYPAPVPR